MDNMTINKESKNLIFEIEYVYVLLGVIPYRYVGPLLTYFLGIIIFSRLTLLMKTKIIFFFSSFCQLKFKYKFWSLDISYSCEL